MPALSNVQDLIPLLGSVASADDPIAALERSGHSLTPALKTSLRRTRVLPPGRQTLWNKTAAKAGKLTFTAGRRPRIAARQLAPGEFEFVAGIRMSAANEILAGLGASGIIPDVLFLDELVSEAQRQALAGAFRFNGAVPGGVIGRMLVTGPVTVSSLGDGRDNVAFNIPFRLNFEKITSLAFNQLRQVVTFATGRLRLVVGLTTRVIPITASARNLEIQVDLSNSIDARLDLDASSPVQRTSPAPPGQVDGLAVILQNILQQKLANTLRLTISAALPLPIGGLEIRDTKVVTRGDAILLGIKIQGTSGTGDPNTLTPLFPDAQTNLFTRVHDQVMRLLIQKAAASGQLTTLAKQSDPDAVIDSADVSFGQGTIQFQATGKIVDACPLGVDVGFTATVTLKLTLEGTRIRVDKDTSIDLDNSDVALCILTSLGIALFAAVAVFVMGGFWAALYAFGTLGALTLLMEYDGDDLDRVLSGAGGGGGPTFIELDFPFPGTDLLPTLTGMFLRLDESTMLMSSHLGTRPDTLNTYFYVRFMQPDAVGLATGIRNAAARMMDRDSVAIPGDDVTLPNPSSSQGGGHGNFVTSTKVHYERTSDETLAQGTTDRSGRVRFYVPKGSMVTKGGNKVTVITRTNLDTDHETTSTTRKPFSEARPDIYFRVTPPNASALDTLQLTHGFFLNFASSRVGTYTNPLVISFGGGTVIGGGGGVLVFES
ncbi:MAG: hypothetical protein WDO18_19340 [Acidobacteriota bacterium]